MLAETGRLPMDNPATHLELTMIHEAMVLEYSGRYLALIEWAAALKLLIFFSLLANLFVPWGMATTLTPAALAVAVRRARGQTRWSSRGRWRCSKPASPSCGCSACPSC